MSALVRSELLKLRTTRRTIGLAAGLVALVCFVVVLHGSLFPARLANHNDEMKVFGWGAMGTLFAGLLGALSITAELRHGTIRPTFLVTPRRMRVLAAKAIAAAVVGFLFGVVAEALTIAIGAAVLSSRGIPLRLDGGDVAQLVVGGALAAAVWATLGVGLGALVRNQVLAVAGLCAWLLFIESLLVGELPGAGRYLPGAAAAAIGGGSTITGEVPVHPPLLVPVLGALVLLLYAAAATIAGMAGTERFDVP
jgi:hypothetical protein